MRSPLGYQITAIGFNSFASSYAGISVERTIILVMALAGCLAGLADAAEVTGLKYLLFEQVSHDYGFDAIGTYALKSSNLLFKRALDFPPFLRKVRGIRV